MCNLQVAIYIYLQINHLFQCVHITHLQHFCLYLIIRPQTLLYTAFAVLLMVRHQHLATLYTCTYFNWHSINRLIIHAHYTRLNRCGSTSRTRGRTCAMLTHLYTSSRVVRKRSHHLAPRIGINNGKRWRSVD